MRHLHLRPFSHATECRLWILASLGFSIALMAIFLPGRVVLQVRQVQSVPFTMGLRLSSPPRWRSGELVAFQSRALPPYYAAGVVFTKQVAAVPGDRLVRIGRDFYVNGRYLASARETDSQGRSATLFTPPPILVPTSPALAWDSACRERTAHLVPDGALFVSGAHPRSFDSRYWGFVTQSEVLGRVVPLL